MTLNRRVWQGKSYPCIGEGTKLELFTSDVPFHDEVLASELHQAVIHFAERCKGSQFIICDSNGSRYLVQRDKRFDRNHEAGWGVVASESLGQ